MIRMQERNDQFIETALPFWNDLTPQDKTQLKRAIQKRHFSAGTPLHNGESGCSGLLLVYSGQVRAYLISDSGREITLYRLFERDICIFTASCMMKDIRFTMYVEAEKDTEAFIIPPLFYQGLCNHSLAASKYMNQLMSSRFSDAIWTMEQTLFTSFDRRLAHFLLEQSTIENSLTLRMTHDTIARNLGSAREVVTRMLKYFQGEGLVSLSRGEITLLDEKRLLALSETPSQKI